MRYHRHKRTCSTSLLWRCGQEYWHCSQAINCCGRGQSQNVFCKTNPSPSKGPVLKHRRIKHIHQVHWHWLCFLSSFLDKQSGLSHLLHQGRTAVSAGIQTSKLEPKGDSTGMVPAPINCLSPDALLCTPGVKSISCCCQIFFCLLVHMLDICH